MAIQSAVDAPIADVPVTIVLPAACSRGNRTIDHAMHDPGDDITCRCCGSHMATDRSESERATTTRWHSCPTCGHVRMTSERDDSRRAMSSTVDEERDDAQGGFEF